MVVKKTIKKTAFVAKRVSPVIVETKKHEETNCCGTKTKNCFTILVIVLLLLNLIVGVWNSLNSNSAWNIEALKVGGRENLELVKKLYEMDSYKEQQKSAIMQVISSFASDSLGQEMILPEQENIQEIPVEVGTE